MIVEESGPVVRRARGTVFGQVLLNSALAQAKPQLEQLTAYTFGSPQRILPRHLLNEGYDISSHGEMLRFLDILRHPLACSVSKSTTFDVYPKRLSATA